MEAARAAQSGRCAGTAKSRDGALEAIRALLVARRSARSVRTKTLNQIREVVRAAIVRLEGLALARRDGNSARTHRLSITPAGVAWLSMAGAPAP